jgi:transcriptional regulator with XRE-family HTH domain
MGRMMMANEGLGERIAALVRLHGGRAAAARAAGISTDQISRYVQGRSSPGFETLARLAQGHGVSLDWLWSGEGAMLLADRAGGPPQAAGTPGTAEAARTADPADSISPELVRLVSLYWLKANTLLESPRAPEDLARLIAGQCDAMRGEERAADHFVRHLGDCAERHGDLAGGRFPGRPARRGGDHTG